MAKSDVKEFLYEKTPGIVTKRKVFVIQEDENRICGLDLTKFTEEEIAEIKAVLKEHEVTLPGGPQSHEPIEGWKADWSKKGWRQFSKKKIVLSEKKEN